jgi:hypothetical protein
MMLTETVHVIRGVLEETELAALITVLHGLSQPTSATTPDLTAGRSTSRRAPWSRPRRRSGPAWVAALDN